MRIADALTGEGYTHMHGDTGWSGGRRRSPFEFHEGYIVTATTWAAPKCASSSSAIS